jgi:hypothetical protein
MLASDARAAGLCATPDNSVNIERPKGQSQNDFYYEEYNDEDLTINRPHRYSSARCNSPLHRRICPAHSLDNALFQILVFPLAFVKAFCLRGNEKNGAFDNLRSKHPRHFFNATSATRALTTATPAVSACANTVRGG